MEQNSQSKSTHNPWTDNSPAPQDATRSGSSDKNNQQPLDRLADAAEAYIKQERWSRRWTNVLKIAVIVYIFGSLLVLAGLISKADMDDGQDEHIALVKLEGQIMPGAKLSAENTIPLLRKAFENPNAKAILLDANSPGGSPVQSALINDEIIRLKQLHNKPVYAVAQDICASGCYYIVAAADEIYANKGSLIGSIGVRFDSFAFTGLMEKIGVENRSMTAGEHKTFINPFGEEDPEAKEFFQKNILEKTHEQFKTVVRTGRGDRLKETKDTFSGLIWLGEDAVENGLIDGLADVGMVSRDIIGINKIRNYEMDKTIMEQLMGDLVSETSLRLSQYFIGLR